MRLSPRMVNRCAGQRCSVMDPVSDARAGRVSPYAVSHAVQGQPSRTTGPRAPGSRKPADSEASGREGSDPLLVVWRRRQRTCPMARGEGHRVDDTPQFATDARSPTRLAVASMPRRSGSAIENEVLAGRRRNCGVPNRPVYAGIESTDRGTPCSRQRGAAATAVTKH